MPRRIKSTLHAHTAPKDYTRKPPKTNAPPSGQWYAVIINPQCEKRARVALQGDFMVYLPVTAKIQRTGGRQGREAVIERPLFPRYLFVASYELAFKFFNLRSVKGVESVVSCEGRPMPIPHGVIKAIMARESTGEFDFTRPQTLEDMGLSTGDQMRMKNGAFGGIVGIIKALMPKQQAKVMLNILGKDVELNIALAELEKVA